MSSDFHTISVKDIHRSTSDSVIVTLDVPQELRNQFKFKQGQYLTFKKEINGEEIRRSYSLCSSPLDNEWKVGIKKVEDGRFSTFANEELTIGDELESMAPSGHFFTEVNKEVQKNYIAFAAGSGITPIYSIIKTHLKAEPNSTFKLFYINQKVSTIILKEELEGLKNQFMERFEIFHFLTRQNRAVPLFNGRMDNEKLETIFKTIANYNTTDHFFSCGPESMILMIKEFLESNGVDPKKIHFELFGTNTEAQSEKKAAIKNKLKGKTCDVTITEGGKTYNFEIEQGSDNILDAALNNDADMPFACKGGVCATCKAKLVEGEVDMLLSYGLEEEEKEKGFILTCQAIPTCDKVVVDFDI